MRAKVTRTYKGMPEGAKVGDEIDIEDADFAEQRRLGNVDRAQAQGGQAQGNQGQNQRPQANQSQDKSPTAVDPMSTRGDSTR